MPIYEYRCQACDQEFEDLVKMSTPDSDIVCPSCGKRRARRLLSMFAGHTASSAGGSGSSACGPGGSGFS